MKEDLTPLVAEIVTISATASSYEDIQLRMKIAVDKFPTKLHLDTNAITRLIWSLTNKGQHS